MVWVVLQACYQLIQRLMIVEDRKKENAQETLEVIVAESSIRPKPNVRVKQPALTSRIDDVHFDYNAASIQKAEEYRNAHSYKRKLPTGEYTRISMCSPNRQLIGFGVGIYLYLELFRQLAIVFVVLSLVVVTNIVFNCLGSQYDAHSASFSNYLIRTTFGNYNQPITKYDAYVQTGLHCLTSLIFFVYVIIWKGHSFREVKKYEHDNNIVHPRKYCVEVEGLPRYGVFATEIKEVMESFGPVYQVCIVRDMKNKLSYFHQLDDMEQDIREYEMQVSLGKKSAVRKLARLNDKKHQLKEQIAKLTFEPKARSCYVHFEYQSSKQKMLDYYNQHYLFGSKMHRCFYACCKCCFSRPEQKYLYKGEKELRVKAMDVPDPDEINWQSINITRTQKFFRVLLAILIIIVFLGLISIIMAICSVFITSNTYNCVQFKDLTLEQVKASSDELTKKCYCTYNIVLIFDQQVKAVCLAIFQKVYLYNGLQILSAIISTISNVLFTIVVEKLVDFTRPSSLTSAHISKTVVLFLFLFINTCIVPVLIFSDINGVQLSKSLSLLDLNTKDIPYFSDFSSEWYRTVSPYFTNFLIIDVIVVWFKFVWQVCRASCKLSLAKKKEGKTIQRRLNKEMTDYQIDLINYLSQAMLIVFIGVVYCAGIPILLPLCLLSLISRYITAKALLLGYSSRIDGVTEDLNEISYILMPLASLFGCLMGIWMLTANTQIYPGVLPVALPVPSAIATLYNNIFERGFYLSYTFVLACLVLAYVLLYNTLVRFMQWLVSLCYCSHQPHNTSSDKQIPFSQTVAFLTVLHSYDIHQNDKYKNAVQNMQKYLRSLRQQHA